MQKGGEKKTCKNVSFYIYAAHFFFFFTVWVGYVLTYKRFGLIMYFYYKIENGTDLSRGYCRLPEVTRQRWYGLVKKVSMF